MSSSRKRKSIGDIGAVCILSNGSCKPDDNFTYLSSKTHPDDEFNQLVQMRNMRQAENYVNSHYRLDNVCTQIPDTIDQLDFSSAGWHRLCRNKFFKHKDRLQAYRAQAESPRISIPTKHHSPRKPSVSTTEYICVLCDKGNICNKQVRERPTVECPTDGENKGWKQVVKMSFEMQKVISNTQLSLP